MNIKSLILLRQEYEAPHEINPQCGVFHLARRATWLRIAGSMLARDSFRPIPRP